VPAATNNVVASATTPTPSTLPGANPAGSNGGISIKNNTLNINGYVQTRFTEAPITTSTFEVRRARVIFEGRLTDTIGYQVQLDGVKPQLLDARVDVKPLRQFGVTIGQFKIPFSTESMTSDNLLPFIERSTVDNLYAPGRENASNGRDIGLQFLGKTWRANGIDRLEYFVGVFNGAGINTRDDNHYKDTAARLLVRPFKQFAIIGNYYNGAVGTKEISRERYDLEFNFVHGPFTAAGEYIWGHDGPVRRNGWYAHTTYRIAKKWEGAFRFDKFSPRQHTATLTAMNNYVIGASYFLNPYVKLQANYGRQQDLFTDRSSNVVLLQTQFQFGGERAQK